MITPTIYKFSKTQTGKRKQFAEALELLDMRQATLAAEFEISQPRISNLLSGQRPIRRRHEMALECVLRQRDEWPLDSMIPKAAATTGTTRA